MGISLHLHGNDMAVWIGHKQMVEFVAKANPCSWTTLVCHEVFRR